MNKKLLLLAGILALGATTFAAHTPTPSEADATITPEKAAKVISITDSTAIKGLLETRQTGIMGEFSGSYAGEVKVAMEQGPGRSNAGAEVNTVEWTVAEGKLNMGKLGFSYSADRDYKFDKDWNKTREGWDTSFGLDYQAGTFNAIGKEWTFVPKVAFGYDTKENYTSDSATPKARDSESKRRWDFIPKVSTTHYGFAMDISPIIAYDDVNETVAFELDVTNYRSLGTTGYWSTSGDVYLDFAGTKKDGSYANSIYAGSGINEDNKFDLSIEQYLDYEREVAKSIYFKTQFGLEAYSVLSSAHNDVAMFVAPELQHRAKLGQVNVTSYVKYTAYTATGGYKTTATTGATSRDEAAVGVKFSTSF
jgi:hypothetical protein